MKKTTQGIVAGLAGLALITSGGTFALWNFQANSRPDVIYTGDMSISAPDGAKWQDMKSGAQINPSTFRASPGDKLRLRIPLQVKATGTNARPVLNAELGTTPAKLAAAGASATFGVFHGESGSIVAADLPAGTKLNASIPVTQPGKTFTPYVLEVYVNVSEASTGQTANQLIDLGAIVYSLTQTVEEEEAQ
jgi:alternate signal-mediated exported protein